MVTLTDRYFAAKAIAKEVDSRVKELEEEVKAQAVADYKEGRGGQVRSPFFGKDAGYVTVIEGTPDREYKSLEVIDGEELANWMEEKDLDLDFMRFALEHASDFAKWYFDRTGEKPDGCDLLPHTVKGKEPTARATVKKDVVFRVLEEKRPELMKGVELLLGDGE